MPDDDFQDSLQEQLEAIWRVADDVSRHVANESARKAAQAVLRYFSNSERSSEAGVGKDLVPGVAGTDPRATSPAAEQQVPMIDIVRLLDALASETAMKERRKISLDLHDGTIQPYLGLRLGLESLRRKVEPSNPLAGEIDELCEMAEESIAELRNYVRGLKGEGADRPLSLIDGVRRQIERFGRFYGIDVDLDAEPALEANEHLAGELAQIVSEGLSNIGRHTASRRVTVKLFRHKRCMVAEMVNHDSGEAENWRRFTPNSISQRVLRLGGTVVVSWQRENGDPSTVVRVEIPF